MSMQTKLGVAIVGFNGALSTTMVAGARLMAGDHVPRLGMLTEQDRNPAPGERITDFLRFPELEGMVFAGWDLAFDNVYEASKHHKVLPLAQLDVIRGQLEQHRPWPAVFSDDYVANCTGEHVFRARSLREEIDHIAGCLEAFKAEHGLDEVVVVNLASTEQWQEVGEVHQTLSNFERGLDTNDPAISPAMRYFYVANRLRCPYLNFTPSLTNVPALQEMAEELGNPYAGMDGKTGQTLVKTALAAMFKARNLAIEGWYSTNILGNNDGLVLDSPKSNKTKIMSKSSVLDSIVGYPVENHQVHIHYYRPRGDAKEAWDNIDIVGFAGVPMQMKINFLCQDSVLGAPLILDLVRLLAVAKRKGHKGIQRQLSLYFKSPYTAVGEQAVHNLFEQEALLLDWAKANADR
jgi:myo-inositol-1-phosphate synthase